MYEVWISWQHACRAHTKLWALSPALCKLGMVVDTCDTNTEEVEATDQGFEIIYDCKVSSSLAWDTQKPVSKANKQTSKTNKQTKAKGKRC